MLTKLQPRPSHELLEYTSRIRVQESENRCNTSHHFILQSETVPLKSSCSNCAFPCPDLLRCNISTCSKCSKNISRRCRSRFLYTHVQLLGTCKNLDINSSKIWYPPSHWVKTDQYKLLSDYHLTYNTGK